MKLTYKKAGVDIAGARLLKDEIKSLVRKSFGPQVLKDIGGFGSFFEFSKGKFKDPVLVSSTDGVGTKLKIAVLAHKHDTVGIDCVAMNVNDILCTGAEPLFFLDYMAYTTLDKFVLLDVVRGLNRGAQESGCSLIGGETAQMPGMYKRGEYDLAGFCVGVVEKKDIIDGSRIEAGDMLIGLESSGLHSNGYSLVRKVLSQKELKRMSAELLKPTRIYVRPVLHLLRTSPALLSDSRRDPPLNLTKRGGNFALRTHIKGISHITGGAFYDKIARILPDNVFARIHKDAWAVPPIFRLIQNKGSISDREMYHTFNMGVGMVLVVQAKSAKAIVQKLSAFKLRSWVIGEVIKGKKEVGII
ncbi:MAG: phosphoribosylformylglycinamidine cyclo-ligase [Candidatus Omnitrophota bacterium]